MQFKFELMFKSFRGGFELEINKKEMVSLDMGILLLMGIPVYLLNLEEVQHEFKNGLILMAQTMVQIMDDIIHTVEASMIYCFYMGAYLADTVYQDSHHGYTYSRVEPLIDKWVDYCNDIKNLRSEWFMNFYDWSWGAVEFPYQLIFIKEEHGIIPCFLQDAAEASSLYETQKKMVSIFL